MDSILKKGVLLVSMTGIMTAFPMVVHAADIDDMQNITAGREAHRYWKIVTHQIRQYR